MASTVKPSEMPDDEFNQCLQAAMEAGETKLNLTKEEQDNFTKAMKKPEFTKLLKEYMDEISDPKHREEQEAYLRQLEKDNKVPEHMKLIYPEAAFCIKVRRLEGSPDQLQDKGKVFINVCTSDEIGKPSHTKEAKGVNWQLPYSLGPLRHEQDNAGEAQPTFDFCLHPATVHQYGKNPQFRKMIIDTALDAVEARVKQVLTGTLQLKKDTVRVLKNVTCIGGKPAVMQIGAQTNAGETTKSDNNAENKKQDAADQAKKQAAPKSNRVTPPKVERPENEPKHTITHRGQVDIADFVESKTQSSVRRPKELVIRIAVPAVKSAKYLDIETSELSFKLTTTASTKADYKLDLDLPYPVDADNGRAKFDKETRTLEVILPVQQQAVEKKEEPQTYWPENSLIQELPETESSNVAAIEPDVGAGENMQGSVTDSAENDNIDKQGVETTGLHARWVDSATAIMPKGRESEEEEALPSKEMDTSEMQQEPSAKVPQDAPVHDPEITESLETPANELERLLEAAKAAAKLPLPKAEDNLPVKPESAALPEPGAEPKEAIEDETRANTEEIAEKDFYSKAEFSGKRPGMVFKTGTYGLGYYRDHPPVVGVESPPMEACKTQGDAMKPTPSSSPDSDGLASTEPAFASKFQLQSKEIFELD